MFGQVFIILKIASAAVSGIPISGMIPFIPLFGIAWWIPMLISLLGPSLLQQLTGGGGGEQQTSTSTTTGLPGGYQSPTLGLQDLLMQGTLGKNLQMFGGAGMPGGQTIAPDFLKDFMDLIGSEYGNLQGKYTNPTPATDKCAHCQQYAPNGPNENANYYGQCMTKCNSSPTTGATTTKSYGNYAGL